MKHQTRFRGGSEDDGELTAGPPTGDPGDAITQADLLRYLHLNRRKQLLDAEWTEHRESLLSRLEAGALEEDGPVQVRVERSVSRRFSAQKLEQLLGPEQVERLEGLVQLTVSRRLVVTVSGC